MELKERCKLANELIQTIAATGRKFFNHEKHGGKISSFTVWKDTVFFIDGNTEKWIPGYSDSFKFQLYFSEGGTLQALVLDIAEFIRTGKATNGLNGYGGLLSSDWGYSDSEMSKVKDKAKEIGFLKAN